MDNLRCHISYWKKRPIQEPQTGGVTMVQQLRKSITTLAFFAIGAAARPTTAPPTTTGSVKLGPRVRAESLAQEQIPSIPAAIIEPFLVRPLIVEPDGLDRAPTIVGTQTDRVILAAGNSAYVRG